MARALKLAIDAQRLEGSFYAFCKDAWEQVDPSPFVDNWHLEDICNHIEAVVFGHIPRLLINEPPRTGKSFIVSVCLIAWIWAQCEKGPLSGPQVSAFYASYAEKLSLEHSLKCRRLIESRWYQERWGNRFKLVRDTQGHFENNKGGYRMCSSVDAKATGFGADLLVADDPHLVQEAESDDIRNGTVRWWCEAMPSRMNNRQTGAMIVVMQRVHEGDLSGYVLAEKLGYTWICVPMSYVPCKHVNAWVGNRIKTFLGDEIDEVDEDDIFWVDPREDEGELLWPDRFPQSDIYTLEKELGPYAYAGQYQQTPAPRGGGIIREDWWQTFDAEAAKEYCNDPDQLEFKKDGTPKKYPDMEFVIAALDTAYTEKEENDPSALSIWGIFRDRKGFPKIMLQYAWTERYAFHDLVSRVAADCKSFNIDRLLIEDKAAGHTVSQELGRLFGFHNFGVELVNPRTGFIKSHDKVTRLQAVVHLFAEGLVFAPDVEWADDMIKQCATVPRAIHDDLADTMSMALLWLRRAGWALRKEERTYQLDDEVKYRPRSGALYPV